MKLILAAALLGGAVLAMDAQAAGNAEAGADKVGTCVACHGTDGKGLAPIYPNLNGQSATYLESSLKAYRDGQRQGGNAMLMTPMAQGLSDEDVADIAAYYSSQE
ncbi:cytochrome c [Halomonas sp. H10-9-1]|uniref:c-type cytochrome n=1 Tax=Halomonas sp. H10-9-1 TaxID=2950871 RepID=UPI0032DF260B